MHLANEDECITLDQLKEILQRDVTITKDNPELINLYLRVCYN